ncbi:MULTISPECIES: class I SAM-dependent methyltransferase [Rhodococcus]|uniref:class I SAM-dependent methyltransferase n=1 Tax=Rhodococcus TaxID=1827 RepID=UPI000622CEF4|nr:MULTISPECIES: methyltransferase domain-containing protein [Rhodococcus]AKE88756.1 methyltransferase [Rhodococcus aetherivorans]MBC2591587.1 methyltransferase domain-containing protein [Rhodococcus aetherivorans]PND51363.1 SAM-dependent methyltransferase [Rhodococcus sp. ENV425]WKW99796.1 methyltransferase domain-containing protein [Rhodococcus aetherivorans]
MLTVDFDRLGVKPGDRAIDIGAGAGRHSFELYRRGADVVAFDRSAEDMKAVGDMFAAMELEGQVPEGALARAEVGDALALPYDDETFDVVLISEVLEHVPEDDRAIAEFVRVLKPGGVAAVTVPRWLPEKICWALSDAYHEVEGGHVRIYKADELAAELTSAGLMVRGREHAHALHSPYWWLKCAVGVDNDDNPLTKAYHRLLVWDLMQGPWLTRTAESLLNPVLGKSVVFYLEKPTVPVAGR